MNSLVVCGRLLISRALATGVTAECRAASQPDLGLMAASAGIGKSLTRTQMFLPEQMQRLKFGDDACFISRGCRADTLGVADGVGGWHSYGIDPSVISTSLMAHCSRIAARSDFEHSSPIRLLAGAFAGVREEKMEILGSTTACVVSLCHKTRTLHTANLGDSGFMVVRSGGVVHRSQEQLHYFNTPFQLTCPPAGQEEQVINDSVEEALVSSVQLEEGDVVLLATDGLFDNLHDEMILAELSKIKSRTQENVQRVANSLAARARLLAFDPEYASPFSRAARDFGYEFTGGKPDDITIVLAVVTTRDAGVNAEQISHSVPG